MQSYSNLYTYASQKTSNSYKNYVTLNYENYPTVKPTFNKGFSSGSINFLNDKPTVEPTEYVPSMPSPQPPLQIENNRCICMIERNNESNILIIATSVTSSLCVTFFLILIWYRFIFKKNLLKWKTNETNFGFGDESI
jgi:hypothetical protein